MSITLETVGRDELREVCLAGKFSDEYLNAVKQLMSEEEHFLHQAKTDLFSALAGCPYKKMTYDRVHGFSLLRERVEIREVLGSPFVIVQTGECSEYRGTFSVSFKNKTFLLSYSRRYRESCIEPDEMDGYPEDDFFANEDEKEVFKENLIDSEVYACNDLGGY